MVTMSTANIMATVIAYGKNRDNAEKLQSQLDTVQSEWLKDGIKAIYARDGIRVISVAEMEALAAGKPCS